MRLLTKYQICITTNYLPFVWIIDVAQTDIFFVLELTVEITVIAMEPDFVEDERDISPYQHAIASLPVTAYGPGTRFQPPRLILGFFQDLCVLNGTLKLDSGGDTRQDGPLAILCGP